MSIEEFDVLLAERDEARADHAEWCEEHECSETSSGRVFAYARVLRIQAKIDAALAAEREAES